MLHVGALCYEGDRRPGSLAAWRAADLGRAPVARKLVPQRRELSHRRHQHAPRTLIPYAAPDGRALPESSQPRNTALVAPLSLVPGALSLLSLLLVSPSESACAQANAVAALGAALLFLLYFCTSLAGQPSARPGWVSRLAAALRPTQDHLLRGCALATVAQLGTAAWLCLSYPRHLDSPLVPLYTAGYLSLAVLAASQQRRPLKGRVRMEIEVGEGERHSVMAQGSRLAARNYAWSILLLHLATQAAAGAAAAAASNLLPLPLVVSYGILALLYGAAGAFKFLPGMEQGDGTD